MKWTVEKKTLVGLGFVSVILVSINALAYWRVSQNKNTFNKLAHIRKVLEQLATVSSALKDAETGQRGYLLTGKERYLEPYVVAVAKVKPEIQALRKLTTDNLNQQRQVDTLDSLTQVKLTELSQTINLRRNQGFEAAQQIVLTDQGRQIMDKIHTVIQEMEQQERNQREQSLQEVQRAEQKDTLISTSGIVFSCMLFYFVYRSIKRELAARRQAEWAQQKLNTETYEALQREQELNNLKSRIITVISHEYRTPLTTILSSAELLEHYNHNFSEEKKNKYLQRIIKAVNHLTTLVSDMMDISQAEMGKLEFNPVPLDLEPFCRQLVEELQMGEGRNHAITFVRLGDCSSRVADAKLLRQIFKNLLLNAIKYSPQNSTIHFDIQCQGNTVVFLVQDEGIGIPEADQAQLFKPLERASNVGTISGTGLGLAIAKKLVDLHGGQIAVDSTVGIGTTFTVTLPLTCQSPTLHLPRK